MSEAAEHLKPSLAALPPDDGEELARFLLESFDDPADAPTPAEVDASWLPELDRRLADAESGKSPPRPIDELLKMMREKYP